jgi:hypothetical protein
MSGVYIFIRTTHPEFKDDSSARKDVPVTIQCVSQQILLSGFGG